MKTIFGGIGMSFAFIGFIFMIWNVFSGTVVEDFAVYAITFSVGLLLFAISFVME